MAPLAAPVKAKEKHDLRCTSPDFEINFRKEITLPHKAPL